MSVLLAIVLMLAPALVLSSLAFAVVSTLDSNLDEV
jgi:hypothetical protein